MVRKEYLTTFCCLHRASANDEPSWPHQDSWLLLSSLLLINTHGTMGSKNWGVSKWLVQRRNHCSLFLVASSLFSYFSPSLFSPLFLVFSWTDFIFPTPTLINIFLAQYHPHSFSADDTVAVLPTSELVPSRVLFWVVLVGIKLTTSLAECDNLHLSLDSICFN